MRPPFLFMLMSKSVFKTKVFPNLDSLESKVQTWKNEGKTIVFTNGCFDILHLGHVTYLEEASQTGDKLIVAVNSDDSVRRLKGENRPIQDEASRLSILAALESVDAVVLFPEDTPIECIQKIKPDVLVKGGDYTIDQIVGSHLVLQNGGKVLSLSLLKGHSTTLLEAKVKKNDE